MTSLTIMTPFMLTSLMPVISCGCSYLIHLTAMMSYDVCKRIEILCVHNLTRMLDLRI